MGVPVDLRKELLDMFDARCGEDNSVERAKVEKLLDEAIFDGDFGTSDLRLTWVHPETLRGVRGIVSTFATISYCNTLRRSRNE